MRVLGTVKAWMANLFFARLHGEAGVIHTENGVQYVTPNPSAMWPPHRPHPTPKRQRKPKDKRMARERRTIHGAMRAHLTPAFPDNVSRYLNASRSGLAAKW